MPIIVPTPNTVITSAWGKSVADAINGAIPHELAYTQLTAIRTVTSTTEVSADAVIIGPAVTYDGATPVLVECFAPAALPPPAASAQLHLWLYQDGVSIGRLAFILSAAAAQAAVPVHAARRLTPTAGSHQFTFAATVSGASGSVNGGPGGVGQYMPGYIRVTRAA